jgi:hypothetical protein
MLVTEAQAKRVRKVLKAWDGPRDSGTLRELADLALAIQGAKREQVIHCYRLGIRAGGEPPEVRQVMCEKIAMLWLERQRAM